MNYKRMNFFNISLIASLFALSFSPLSNGSTCSDILEKLSKLDELSFSKPLLGKSVKQMLMMEEKFIEPKVLKLVNKRAINLSNGDNILYQKLALEPFMYAILICREKNSLNYNQAFNEAVNTLIAHDKK